MTDDAAAMVSGTVEATAATGPTDAAAMFAGSTVAAPVASRPTGATVAAPVSSGPTEGTGSGARGDTVDSGTTVGVGAMTSGPTGPTGLTGAMGPTIGVDAVGLAVDLAVWFGSESRDLPWRRTRDPWAVLVSELMLQQTGVARVEPRYRRFLERFPTPDACAAATPGAVVEEWQGLGYNRRAVNLHRCAVAVVADHDGRLPDDLDALLALPGVGPYTARAVLAFAFERPVACMDVNVTRTLTRLAGRSVTQDDADRLAEAAEEHAPGGAWVWNQAVMELGATVCRPRPRCDTCPVAERCAWRGGGGDVDVDDPWERPRRQSRFEGSDRQGRGRLVDALRRGPVAATDLPAAMGWPDDVGRAERVAATLLADGLAVVAADGTWHLP